MDRIAMAVLALGRTLDLLGAILVWMAAAMLGAMVLLINVEVFGRYAVGFSTLIADEYSGYLFTWMTLLCAVYALRSERMLKVEAGVRLLPPAGRDVALLLSSLLGAVVSLALVYATWQLLSINWIFNSSSLQPSRTPLWVPQSIMPVGFALLCLAYLERLLAAILRLSGHIPRSGTM